MYFDDEKKVFVIDDKSFIDKHGFRHYVDFKKLKTYNFYQRSLRLIKKNGLNHGWEIRGFKNKDDEEIQKARLLVELLQKRKTINMRYSSYNLKHLAEKFLRSDLYCGREGEAYVSNGAFIIAMLEDGYIFKNDIEYFKVTGMHSISVNFNISTPVIEGIYKKVYKKEKQNLYKSWIENKRHANRTS